MLNIPGNIKLFTVQSGSMEPTISTGSLIIVKPMETYAKEDIINIIEPADPKVSVTHRIIDIEEADNGIYYITKGDANESADTEKRSVENVSGKVIFSLPLLGYLLAFAKTGAGLVVFIIIPALIIIVRELISIKEEAKTLIQRKKVKNSSKGSSIAKALLILALVSMGSITSTAASLLDTEISTGNTMTAGVWAVEETEVSPPLMMSLSLPEEETIIPLDDLLLPIEEELKLEETPPLLSVTSLPDEVSLETPLNEPLKTPLEVPPETPLESPLLPVEDQIQLELNNPLPDPPDALELISEVEIIEE